MSYPYSADISKRVQPDRQTEDYNKRLHTPDIHPRQAGVSYGTGIDLAGAAGIVIQIPTDYAMAYTLQVRTRW
jgi:hypothetical protein